MQETTLLANAMYVPAEPSGRSEPSISKSIWIAGETRRMQIACVDVYLPERIPPSVRAAVEAEVRRTINSISDMLAGMLLL